ncbi:MAG: glucose-1-phosphate adenylyltransferase [Granulosicoccus sp.]|nr:glucose-1-phosphate adenylyltransferase [Granulosicoccus sp.]
MSIIDESQISRLTRDTLALILAGGQGSRLYELTKWRAKPAVPFGGKFRIIDFALSNCINSGIRRVGVVTQYKAHSLVRHIIRGWSGFKAEFGEFVEILPASKRVDEGWYKGTADAVYQNLDIIRTHKPRFVLVLGGDHIYKMDYGPLISSHNSRDADMTLCCVEVSVAEAAGAFGVVKVDSEGRVLEFQEKPAEPAEIPGKPGRVLASMGNYVFNTEFLYQELIRDADTEGSSNDFGKDLLPHIVSNYSIFAFRLGDDNPQGQPYWRDVGTLDAFWEANMELVDFEPELDLYDTKWPVYTYQMQLPSAKFVHDTVERRGMALNCIVSGGCIISGGKANNSLLFSNVRVRSYSDIQDSVIMPNVTVGRNCTIKRAIVDTGTILPEGSEVGIDAEADRAKGYRVTDSGITLVTPDHFGQKLHFVR